MGIDGNVGVVLACCSVGVLLSLYMTAKHFGPANEGTFCDFNSVFSCSDILNSPWAYLLGTPIAVLGLAWNATVLRIAWALNVELSSAGSTAPRRHFYSDALFLWLCAGIGFVVYLVAVELYVGKICPLCTVIHVLSIASFCAAYRQRKRAYGTRPFYRTDSPLAVVRAALRWERPALLIALVGFGGSMLLFNSGLVARRALDATPADAAVQQSVASPHLLQCVLDNHVRMLSASSRCTTCPIQRRYFGDTDADRTQLFAQLLLDCDAASPSPLCAALPNAALKRPVWVRYTDSSLTAISEQHNGLLSVAQLKQFAKC